MKFFKIRIIWRLGFRDHSIGMFVPRGTTTQKTERFCSSVPQLVLLSRTDGYRVAGNNFLCLAFDTNLPGAMGDVIDFFSERMIMFLGCTADRQARFSEAL